ncbi:hypothetical protein GCU67_20350 [Modestobacter muralis]|uniref:Uncharacterized protein n=1 Tax=Modestobacter muralis TaxID=1608614 RepID=A0A6P0EXS6_9ACTN|nr:hypothetical protein [Modestobacter muralis]NEK96501.1 hypothetical protein [Modestobacter muralis]NEN53401.1 hypothetical protein [Modestobacter muralis]
MTSHNPGTSGQQFVRATVHLAGAVTVETGHMAQYSAEHIQARIGGVLIYFLDLAAVDAFAASVSQAAEFGRTAFRQRSTYCLPDELIANTQEVCLVVRLQGHQEPAERNGAVANDSTGGRGHVIVGVGALRLFLHDPQALQRLVHVTDTVARLAAALWPALTLDEIESRDTYAERWEEQQRQARR